MFIVPRAFVTPQGSYNLPSVVVNTWVCFPKAILVVVLLETYLDNFDNS